MRAGFVVRVRNLGDALEVRGIPGWAPMRMSWKRAGLWFPRKTLNKIKEAGDCFAATVRGDT